MNHNGMVASFRWRLRLNHFFDILFPDAEHVCMFCRSPMPTAHDIRPWSTAGTQQSATAFAENTLCPFCWQDAKSVKLAAAIRSIAHPSLGARLSTDAPTESRVTPVLCAFVYTDFVRTALRHWKYDGVVDLTSWFVAGILQAVKRRAWGHEFDMLVPAPTSRDRIRQRGYNQAMLLARHLREALAVPCSDLLVKRASDSGFSQSQSARSRSERMAALQNAIVCVNHEAVYGRRVGLVDDVTTSGATLQACADALYAAGAAAVVGLVIAYVP